MKTRQYGVVAVAAAAILMMSACSPAPPLPPSPFGEGALDSPSTTPEPSSTSTMPPKPSTAVISETGVQSMGLPQDSTSEQQALLNAGFTIESPYIAPIDRRAGTMFPIEKVEAAGGAQPTSDYVLNLAYRLCYTTQMNQGSGVPLSEALSRAVGEVPNWVGFTDPEQSDLATAYLDVAMSGYSDICVPILDPRARGEQENR